MPTYPKIYLYKRLVQAKLFIDGHYTGPIDLNNMAGQAFFSKFHFVRLFKAVYRQTPNQYLVSIRLANAQQLLKKGLPVSQVCGMVGFDSASSFAGLFKKKLGITPSAFQQQQLAMQQAIREAPLQFIPHCFASANGWTEKSNFEEAAAC
jgi:AraC-like DNA-binding protein